MVQIGKLKDVDKQKASLDISYLNVFKKYISYKIEQLQKAPNSEENYVNQLIDFIFHEYQIKIADRISKMPSINNREIKEIAY